MIRIALLLAAAAALAACGNDSESPSTPGGTSTAGATDAGGPKDVAVRSFLLEEDPGEALDVSAAKEEDAGAEVVVVGRVGTIVSGFAVFNLVDTSLAYCGETSPEDKCLTPWDYCCISNAEKAAGTLVVEARGPDGRPLKAAPAGLRLLDLVCVRGTLEKDEHGNVTVVADGWHRRERPELREGLAWPE